MQLPLTKSTALSKTSSAIVWGLVELMLLINVCKKHGLIVNESEWWHFYDERLLDKGMQFNFVESDLKPIYEEKAFTLTKIK